MNARTAWMTTRYCLPRVRSKGYGLGNELLPWARAHLAAQVLGARLLPPAFGLNRREYWRHFATPTDDWLRNRALEWLLPRVEFTQADYERLGGGDVVPVLEAFARERQLFERRAFVFVTDGLWGGYRHVAAAREFIRAQLALSRFAARNLLRLRARLDPLKLRVGMHVRLGDFEPPADPTAYRCAGNIALPIAWFERIARALRSALGERVQFLVVSDGTPAQLRPLLESAPCVTSGDLPDGDCSDALALAECDLLVCSVSTYSQLAVFLSEAPYLWFAPNLYAHAEGCLSLGDPREDRGLAAASRAQAAGEFAHEAHWSQRAHAVGMDGALPEGLVAQLLGAQASRRWQGDLLRGGVVAPPARGGL